MLFSGLWLVCAEPDDLRLDSGEGCFVAAAAAGGSDLAASTTAAR